MSPSESAAVTANGTAPDKPALPLKTQHLIARLKREFADKEVGHCVRVDHLQGEEARRTCRALRDASPGGVKAYVLAADAQGSVLPDDLSLFADQAIELRNRKSYSLCLFVPADLMDATASSLGNSFAPFPLAAFLKELARELRADMPDVVASLVRSVWAQLRGAAAVPVEREIDFLSTILNDPVPATVGANLWQVGLIPDYSEWDAVPEGAIWVNARMALNRKCVDILARPLRPQSSVADRINALKLTPNTLQAKLAQYLLGRRLQSDLDWLREAGTRPGELTFDRWEFPGSEEEPDLQKIEIEPFSAASGLRDLNTGSIPKAPCGEKAKLTVKWKATPVKPTDVGFWRVELVPSRDRSDVDEASGMDLPQTVVKGSARSAKISLNINVGDLPILKMEAHVVALDANSVEMRDYTSDETDADGLPLLLEAFSDPFYLDFDDFEVDETPTTRHLDTNRCLSEALLAYSYRAKSDDVTVTPQPEETRDLLYLPFLLQEKGAKSGARTLARVATTPFLRDLQRRALETPDAGGRFRAQVQGADALNDERIQPDPILFDSLPDTQIEGAAIPLKAAWEKFGRARKAAFDTIRKSRGDAASLGLVEAAELTPALCRQVQEYARAYQELLAAAADICEQPDKPLFARLVALLQVDTLTLDFGHGDAGQARRRATLILPTHPLRLLWYVAYAKWVDKIADDLRATPSSGAKREVRFDRAALGRVAPLNLPAFMIREQGGKNAEMFGDNLGLFYGICVPLDTGDPGALLAEVARAVGYERYEPALTDLKPQALAQEIKDYLKLHPYLQTVRVNAVNPGSGEFLGAALNEALKPQPIEDDSPEAPALALDLITHTESSAQVPASGLEALAQEWYRGGQRQRGSFLSPGVQVARRALGYDSVRALEALRSLPGGDVHLAICQDYHRPELVLSSGMENGAQTGVGNGGETSLAGGGSPATSAALFGLLTRFQSTFSTEAGVAQWTRRVAFGETGADKHPVSRNYSDLLVDGQEAYLRLSACIQAGRGVGGQVPALRLTVQPEQQLFVDALHNQADWVFTLDRHFGVEYYDSPRDASLARTAERYLLDYTPEFLEGMGHCLVATTGWQDEVADVLARALDELHLDRSARSVAHALEMLKMISGRLALRLIGAEYDTLAKETVSLAVVANYLGRKKALEDTIIVPLDAHQRLFREAKRALQTDTASRCDLLLVKLARGKIDIEFVEVKYRSGNGNPTGEADRIADQTRHTEQALRDLYFALPNERLDSPILRCQLGAILRFYAERARRHGRISTEGQYAEMLQHIARVEIGAARLTTRCTGYIVQLEGTQEKSFKHQETTIHVLTSHKVNSDTDFQRSEREEKATVPAIEKQSLSHTASSARASDVLTLPVQAASGPDVAPSGSAPPMPLPQMDVAGVETPTAASAATQKPAAGEVLPPASPTSFTAEEPRPVAPSVPSLLPQSQNLIIPLGQDAHTAEEVAWTGSVKGSPHLFVLGIPGQGKSWTILRLVSQAAEHGVPSLIIDFHGQFGADLPSTPRSAPSIIDVSRGLPFSPLEASSYRGAATNYWKFNSMEISEIFQYICQLGDMQRDLIYQAISKAYQQAGFADNELDESTPLLTPPTMSEVFSRLQRLEAEGRGVKNTVARCRALFEFGLFPDADPQAFEPSSKSNALRTENSQFTFAALRDRTTVFDLHQVGMETVQAAAGAFVLRKLYKDMFAWGETDRLRLLVVLDEAHRMAKDTTLPKLMKEGRKYGIATVVASQSAQDFHPEVLNNAGTKILFRTNYPLSKKMTGYVKPSRFVPDIAARLESLEVGHALVQTPLMAQGAEVEMYPYMPVHSVSPL